MIDNRKIFEDFFAMNAVVSEPYELLQQVLINLLENAVYHAKGMTELIIAVENRENKAVFFVRDNGCGIPAERLKNLFHGNKSRSEVVATFLAILELCKTSSVTLEDDINGDNPTVKLLEKEESAHGVN